MSTEAGACAGETLEQYISNRWKDQLAWFEKKAAYNQRQYMRMRHIMLVAGWLTPAAILGLTMVPQQYRDLASFVPFILSGIAIGSYQWEDEHHYGSQWAKFRLIAERLKHEREFLIHRVGAYANLGSAESEKFFVKNVEGLIEGTDVNYFTLMVDPEGRSRGAER
jgi:hypothetical protein